jgi:hypothetical protein
MLEQTKQFSIIVQRAESREGATQFPGYVVRLIVLDHADRLRTRQEFLLDQFLGPPQHAGSAEENLKKYAKAVAYANTLGALLGIAVIEEVSDGPADR